MFSQVFDSKSLEIGVSNQAITPITIISGQKTHKLSPPTEDYSSFPDSTSSRPSEKKKLANKIKKKMLNCKNINELEQLKQKLESTDRQLGWVFERCLNPEEKEYIYKIKAIIQLSIFDDQSTSFSTPNPKLRWLPLDCEQLC
jgi:hypothetical protein